MISTQNQRLIGYARVSTNEQELCLQVDALIAHGVTKELLFFDKLSGAREDRPGLAACNEMLRRGDTLVVWRLNRLGRSMRHRVCAMELVNSVQTKAELKQADTTLLGGGRWVKRIARQLGLESSLSREATAEGEK